MGGNLTRPFFSWAHKIQHFFLATQIGLDGKNCGAHIDHRKHTFSELFFIKQIRANLQEKEKEKEI